MNKPLLYLSLTLLFPYLSLPAFSQNPELEQKLRITPTIPSIPQLEVYESNPNKDTDYIITLYSDRSGVAMISYNTPTCQANSHGTSHPDPKDSSKLEFTAREDPHCKITLQKIKNNQLQVIKETLACTTWHGDFCKFKTTSPLTRIYPDHNLQEK